MKPGRPLVISDPTLLVRRDNERLVMLRERTEVAAIPMRELSHVAAHGPVTFTGAALAGLLDEGIDVTLHASSGRLRGVISSAQSKNVYLLLAQVDAWQRPEKRVALARALLAGKIAGQRQLVQRQALDRGSLRCEEAARRLAVFERQVWEQPDVDAARGIEGAASAAYFDVFGEMLSDGWRFPGRVRRPATDPVNAMLSFGYAIAGGEVARALLHRGFDARIGLIHGLRYGRESLVLDVVEEFRAPMVDRFTLRVLNRGQFKVEDFETQPDRAVRLSQEARRRYLELWEEMLSERARALRNETVIADEGVHLAERIGRPDDDADVDDRPIPEEGPTEAPMNWHRRIERQVLRLWRFLMKNEPYVPLTATRKDGVVAPTPEGAPGEAEPRRIKLSKGSQRSGAGAKGSKKR